MSWLTDEEDATMLLDITFTMNTVKNIQVTFKLVDICSDNMLQMLCKSLLCFAKIWKIGCSKNAFIGLVKF